MTTPSPVTATASSANLPRAASSKTRPLRLAGAVILLLAFGASSVWFLRVCNEVQKTDPQGLVTTELTCGPPTPNSAITLVLVLGFLLLLWPDISEISVLGVGLKRKVEAAETKAEAAREEVESLRSTVQMQIAQVALNASASAAMTINLVPPFDEFERQRLRHEAERLGDAKTGSRHHGSLRAEGGEPSDAELKIKLLDTFERLAELLDLYRRPQRRDPREHPMLWFQQRFIEEHSAAIQSVRSLRNAIAHAQPVERAAVLDGLSVLTELLDAAENVFVPPPPHPGSDD